MLAAVSIAVTLVAASCGSSAGSTRSSLVATDIAPQLKISEGTNTHGENCVADFNGDGIPDLLLSTHANPWPLLLGTSDGRFVPYYQGLDPEHADRHGCAVADYNGDGRLDVYFAIGACQGTCRTHKELWIQQPDHTFLNEAAKWGIDIVDDRGRAPVVVTANHDKLPDLFTGAEKGVRYPSFSRLWINKGDHFELQKGPITNELGDLCSAAADIDGDGIDEIAMCTGSKGFYIFKADANGIYQIATQHFGVASYGRKTVHFVDVNHDGKPDLATVTATRVQLFLNKGGKYPSKPAFSLKVNNGVDVAFGDVNGDGTPDMFVLQGDRNGGQIFLNDGSGQKWTPGPKTPAPPGDSGASGDTVTAFPNYKGSHRTAFIVNNGYETANGVRQFWVFSGVAK
jgi:hypothetical protein